MPGKPLTTQPGYENKHGQKHVGKTDIQGSDNMQ